MRNTVVFGGIVALIMGAAAVLGIYETKEAKPDPVQAELVSPAPVELACGTIAFPCPTNGITTG